MRPCSSRSDPHLGTDLTDEIFSGLFARGAVAAEVGDRAWARAMLDVEAALAGALAELGLAPAEAAEEIESACAALAPELDLTALGAGAGARRNPGARPAGGAA